MKNCWEIFPELHAAMRRDHDGKDCGHHPPEHAVMVGQYCLIIAPDENTGLKAAAGALAHNTDRLYPEDQVEQRVRELIALAHFGTSDSEESVDAVLKHSKKPAEDDSLVLDTLRAGDMLSNINPLDIIARSARAFPNLPLWDPRFIMTADPESTYRDPKTVIRDAIHSTLEWETWFRFPKAIELARPYFEGLKMVQALVQHQLKETSLDQCPG